MVEPPEQLSEYARAWWVAVDREFAVEPVDVPLLESACESLDRYREAQADLAANGLYCEGSKGQPAQRPAVFVARESLREFSNLCKQLGIDGKGRP